MNAISPKPAAFSGSFADFKTVRTRSVCQIVIEVPIEQAGAALEALGGIPVPGKEPWVAVARLMEKPQEEPVSRATPASKSLATRAGILCNDPIFWQYLSETFGYAELTCEANAAAALRHHIGIASRRDLDTDRGAAARFSDLDSRFRQYAARGEYAR